MDPYKTLGVDASATDADIKQAFRKLAVQYHPDRGGDESKFKEINTAYDTIKTADKRQQHEMSKRYGGGFNFQTGGNPFDMQDMFTQFFGAGQAQRQRQPVNRNIQISIEVTLEDVYHGNKKQIRVDQINKDLEITIPKGIGNGQSIRYKGLGMSNVPTATPGDLLCKVYVKPHDVFVRERLNLVTEKSISCFDAINGTSVQMPTIEGKLLTVKIPAGTQPGLVMKIPEYGLINQANRVGDCFLKINVSIPKNLTKEDRDDIDRIAKKYP
tara:strand:- start:100 stop:909 length:810 start_codon:yes stop_codon:yes gene_type:complete